MAHGISRADWRRQVKVARAARKLERKAVER